LALMLAQRTDENVIIDAVELDVDAAQQAQENIAQSPWMHRVSVHTEDAQQWIPRQTVRFDLIISNPPYYEQGVECATPQREQPAIPPRSITRRCLRWRRTALRKTVFCVVLPEQIGNAFTQQALSMGWHLRLRTDVAETEARLPHRVLLAFSPQAGSALATGW
jgi:tRNA1Val (adenine37-N6)-methyltransferase